MVQSRKVLLVLYYGYADSAYISDRLGWCCTSVMTRLQKMGLIEKKGYKGVMNIWGLTNAGMVQAERDIYKLSLWSRIKLFLGILSI